MSSFKKLKRDCQHEKGFQTNNNKCLDCGATASPKTQIEHIHQMLMRRWLRGEEGVQEGDAPVKMPANTMLLLRIAAVEEYLEKQHELAENASPIVSLS